MSVSNQRVWLDLASSLLGVLAGIVIIAGGFFGPLTVGSADLGVAAMGLLGAGFAGIGVGHFRIEDIHRGMGEILAGVGAIFVAISYLVTPALIPFAIGVLGLGAGGLVVLAESFGVVGSE
jgi:hypothetical protein